MKKREFETIRISHFPRSVVVVTCKGTNGVVGATTISWTGIVSSRPPVIAVSFLPDSFTRNRILDAREFVINVPDRNVVDAVNHLGSISGPWEEKMRLFHAKGSTPLTLAPSRLINSPRIEEFYLNFECRVLNTLQIGLYDCFLGEVLTMWCGEEVYRNDHPRGRIDLTAIAPVFCIADEYWSGGVMLGHSTENKNHPHGEMH